MSVVELNAITGVGQYLGYETLEFQEFFLWDVMFLLNDGPNAARVGPGQAESRYVVTPRKIGTYPTTLVVHLMIEKSVFTDPSASDIARRATPALARYREPCHSRSVFEIVVTLVPFVALWALAWAMVHFGYWELSFLLGIPASGLLVRLFMIQHDCDMVLSFAIVWRMTGWVGSSAF